MDTWCRETKRTQTKPILTDLPLPARQKTSLTYSLERSYATTPQSRKRTQTNPISPPGAIKLLYNLKQKHKKLGPPRTDAARMFTSYISTNQGHLPYHVFGTKCYDVASDAAALPLSLCSLNNNCDRLSLQKPPTIPTCTPALCWMYLALQPGMHFANIARLQSIRALLFLCARFRTTRCLTHLHPS
jgi:hypothetical protein